MAIIKWQARTEEEKSIVKLRKAQVQAEFRKNHGSFHRLIKSRWGRKNEDISDKIVEEIDTHEREYDEYIVTGEKSVSETDETNINVELNTSTTKGGTIDWGHITIILKKHEHSTEHFHCYGKWIELKKRLSCGHAVDCLANKLYLSELEHWDEVVKRIISIILMMASENIAFRGSSDRIFTKNNGKFLKIVELFSKFDPVLEKHVKRVENPKKPHYLGKKIQREIILLIAKATKDNILEMVKNTTYITVTVDSTPDASHKEQMSIVLRYVHITKSTERNNASVEVKESLLKFINILDSTRAMMTEEILTFLTQNGLSISNLRGQGYDNGAKMRGKINDVQAHITNINPRAFFIACVSHSINLVVVDAVKEAIEIINIFSTIQTIYNFCSRSPKRWHNFISMCCNLTMKSLSDTRWKSNFNAVSALKSGLKGI
ncbi:zinc finger MYM-type protein 1-like [Hydra vulgaris]|uniref:Zinc finger MYM-type protein 1-like n=1 Tax=Hydra vulgaris TaxID=6087 RepID=A0ABM4CA42_HYDVU